MGKAKSDTKAAHSRGDETIGDIHSASRSPFERAYRGILRGLYEGAYVPGQRLAAPDLMNEFRVGRGTVREVLQRLASTGVVKIMQHRGAQVRRFTRREVAEVLDIVELLLGLAARGAARAIADRALRREFKKRYEALRSANPNADLGRFLNAREDYYRCLVSLADNRELQRIFPTIQVQIMRLQLRTFNLAADAADPADYMELTKSILSGDQDRAERSGRLHVQRTIGRVRGLPDRAFDREETAPIRPATAAQ